MQGTMLPNEHTTVDADDLAVRECFLQLRQGFCVLVWLGVSGNQHGAIDDEEVGVGGWQTVALVIIAGVG